MDLKTALTLAIEDTRESTHMTFTEIEALDVMRGETLEDVSYGCSEEVTTAYGIVLAATVQEIESAMSFPAGTLSV